MARSAEKRILTRPLRSAATRYATDCRSRARSIPRQRTLSESLPHLNPLPVPDQPQVLFRTSQLSSRSQRQSRFLPGGSPPIPAILETSRSMSPGRADCTRNDRVHLKKPRLNTLQQKCNSGRSSAGNISSRATGSIEVRSTASTVRKWNQHFGLTKHKQVCRRPVASISRRWARLASSRANGVRISVHLAVECSRLGRASDQLASAFTSQTDSGPLSACVVRT